MDAVATPTRSRSTASRATVLSSALGLVLGLGLASFGVVLPWLAALVAVVSGWALGRNRSLVLLGLGLAAGGVAFIVVGLGWNLLDAPAIGSGSG